MEKVFAVYDSKAEAYLPPFFAQTAGLAIRLFQQAANEDNHNFNKWSEDYTLFTIGEWDQDSGTLFAAKANTSLGTALQYRDDPAFVEELKDGLLEIDGENYSTHELKNAKRVVDSMAKITNGNPAVKWPEKNAPQRS